MKSLKQTGFTLLELMIVVLIIGVVFAIAIPSYQAHYIRVLRADAQTQMMDIANRQEQFLMADRTYVDKATLESSGFELSEKVAANYTYSITLGANSEPSYQITFTPYGSQTSDGELSLDNKGVKTPAAKW